MLYVHDDEHKVSTKCKKLKKENLRETWNSKIEEQCVKPQVRDQSKRVQENKVFNWSK